jgi:SAM-dependent methyltransferase
MVQSTLYTKYADDFDKLYPDEKFLAQALLIKTIILKYGINNPRILDIACGTGRLCGCLSKLGYSVSGLDASRELISIARRNNPKLQFVLGDMRSMILTSPYDVITCVSAFNYLDSTSELNNIVQSIVSTLTARGILIILNVLLLETTLFDRVHINTSLSAELQLFKIGSWSLDPTREHGVRGQFAIFRRDPLGMSFDLDLHELYAPTIQELSDTFTRNGLELQQVNSTTDRKDDHPLFIGRRK